MNRRYALLPLFFLLLACCWLGSCEKLEIPDDTEKSETQQPDNASDDNDDDSSDNSDNDSSDDNDDNASGDDDSPSSDNSGNTGEEADSGAFRGYSTLSAYFKHYGKYDTAPIPFEDMLEGGCLYNYYMYTEAADIDGNSAAGAAHWMAVGYIVGYPEGNLPKGAHFKKDGAGSCILIAASASEKDGSMCIPIELKSGTQERKLFGKMKNISIGTKVQFKGVCHKYYGVVGLKNISEFAIFTDDE